MSILEKKDIMKSDQIIEANNIHYENLYLNEENFLRYPADWIVRFHNMFLRNNIPQGAKILDYGCGSGNNSIFFMQKGYSVFGVDTTPSFKNLVSKNLKLYNIDKSAIDNFNSIDPYDVVLNFPSNHFDFIFSNQVLYYLPGEGHIKRVCCEIKRILRPDGYVFFTMMGPHNYYITHHTKQLHGERIYEVRIEDKKHRLNGLRELIYIVKDEVDLCKLFDMFEPTTTGYFDEKMFDLHSIFHFIFVGKKTMTGDIK